MSIEQAAEAELKSSDEKKRQHPDQKEVGSSLIFLCRRRRIVKSITYMQMFNIQVER